MTNRHIARRHVLAGASALLAAAVSGSSLAAPGNWRADLVAAARAQIGVTRSYDPAYTALAFPGGDVPREKGVCTDVVIRAYRDAFGLDLQALVNADMKSALSAYPRNWALTRPDPSIDHRRVLNLRVYFKRRATELAAVPAARSFEPGDIATQTLPGNLPHIGIVSDRRAETGQLLLIHNIGRGTEESDVLAAYPLTGRFRLTPTQGT